MSRLEIKYADTQKQIKVNSSKIVEQKTAFEKRVQELENETEKEKTERTEETAALRSHIDAEVSELKAKIRQVASEHTVFEGRFTMTRQPNAVHVGESWLYCKSVP